MKQKPIDHFKKFEYKELDYVASSQRSCYTPGRVYRFNSGPRRRPRRSIRGILNNDLLLCINKSGDCYYNFVRIKHETTTKYSGQLTYQLFAYFKVLNKCGLYGGMEEAFPRMETLSPVDLVHILADEKFSSPCSLLLVTKNSRISRSKSSWRKKPQQSNPE